MTTSKQMASPQISLTPPEKLFRQCLLDCRAATAETPGMKDLVMRWTGGWVRDKLLNVQSHDIDVALSSMTGMQFGEALQRFMAEHGKKYEEEAKRQGFTADLKGLHKIAANPEKSKHLETITTRMFGIDVDFVNLRKEVYADNSRNPQMEFGTAEEDALRRDATVNALFYNLDTQQVEDFTNQGLVDMEAAIIRTPLAPYQTFKDDPLRVLRLIRFACRLGYRIEDSSKQAMTDCTIHEALRLKISRERVGVEIEKILRGPDPHTGLTLINDLGLYSTVFADPTKDDSPDFSKAQAAYDALQHILAHRSGLCLALRPKEHQDLSWLLAVYVPWYSHGSKRATQAAREGIRATNTMSKVLDDAISSRQAIDTAVQQVERGTATRGSVGMLLRGLKAQWRSHVLYALLCDAADGSLPLAQQQERYQKFVEYLTEQRLEEAHLVDRTLVLKGNEIKEALGVEKAGPWLKMAVDMVAEWQLDHEGTATKEGAIEMVRARRAELGLD